MYLSLSLTPGGQVLDVLLTNGANPNHGGPMFDLMRTHRRLDDEEKKDDLIDVAVLLTGVEASPPASPPPSHRGAQGFNVITLTDACATTSPEGQAVTGGSYGMFSTPMTVAEYESSLVADATRT